MKKLLTFAVVAAASMAFSASIQWGANPVGSAVFLDNAGTAIAPGAGLVQLIYDGGDGLDGFDGGAADGLVGGGNDVVVDTFLVGNGVAMMGDGKGALLTAYTYGSPYAQNDDFYIRFYDGATVGGSAFYAEVSGFAITAADDLGTDQFYLAAPVQTTTPVPEPGTVMLGLAGLGALVARRRKNRK